MRQRSYSLVLAGGLLAAVAFFLPFSPSGGSSLLQSILQAGKNASVDSVKSILFLLFEPVAALLVIAGGLLSLKRKTGFVWGLSGAVFGLTYLVYLFCLTSTHTRGDAFEWYGNGYWLAVIGCALGLLGALLGWWHQPASAPTVQPHSRSTGGRLSIKPAMLLVLCGGLAAASGLFIPSFFDFATHMSLFDYVIQPGGLSTFWPAPLAAFLLLACSLLALEWKSAYLGGLIGALIGIVFLLLMLLLFGGGPSQLSMGTGYWLPAIGCLLGLVGSLLGARELSSAPVAIDALETPVVW